jgi:hypothetical protein
VLPPGRFNDSGAGTSHYITIRARIVATLQQKFMKKVQILRSAVVIRLNTLTDASSKTLMGAEKLIELKKRIWLLAKLSSGMAQKERKV